MRNACRQALTLLLALLLTIPGAKAQNNPNGLSADSCDPEGDARAIAKIRAEMNRIRLQEGRPTVALVFSGGGAKGAAQVGALKLLDEIGMPVDMVCGTSIGGLVGGLYAIGYTQREMQELFQSIDWDVMLTDYVPDSYIPYNTKMYNSRYILSIPFDNPLDIFNSTELQEEGHEYRRQSITSTLPSGINYGFNVRNLISSLTVGYHDSQEFADLPVPFMCVAADLVSMKAKNWGSGELPTAMRSTMSIPGLFMPVRTDDMVLVDGGIRNNYPTDLAKAAGADIIIGMELSDSPLEYNDVNNIFDVVGQMISMLGDGSYEKNVSIPDVTIKPDLEGYGMMSFTREAVDTMLVRGYEAALAKKDELIALRDRVNKKSSGMPARKGVNISKRDVRIGSITFDGTSGKESAIMARYLEFEAGDTLGREELEHAVMKFQATGAYRAVTYSLYGSEEPYDLVFRFEKSPANNIGLGVRVDSEEWASLLLNIGFNSYTLTGSSLDINAKLGRNIKGEIHYAFNPVWAPTVNFSASISRYTGDIGVGNSDMFYGISYWTHQEQVYLSDARWTKFNFTVGLRNRYANLSKQSYFGSLVSMELSDEALKGDYIGTFISGHLYTLDDYYFPTRGTKFDFWTDYDFAKAGDATFNPVLSIGAGLKFIIPISQRFTLIPDIHIRNIVNTGEHVSEDGNTYKDLSVLHTNFTGGAFSGRYSDAQIPFFGINNMVLSDEYLTSATMELRCNVWKDLFVSAMGGFVESADGFFHQFRDSAVDYWSVGIQAAYKLSTGPIKVNLHRTSGIGWGLYASLGFDF